MTEIVWNGYEPNRRDVHGPLRDLSRADARAAFEQLMQAKPRRLAMLNGLLSVSGVGLEQGDAAVQHLNDWFRTNAEPDSERPGHLTDRWYSVATDIALYLGDELIMRHPHLRWELFVWGKKNVAYHRPVIMGFHRATPKWNIDFERRVATYGHRIVGSRGSIPAYGSVTIRGAEIDVDAARPLRGEDDIASDAFAHWMRIAEDKA